MKPKRRVVPNNKPRPPDPPPEIFKRTTEEKLAAEARLAAEVQAMRDRGVPSTLDDGPVADGSRELGDPLAALADLRARAEAWQAERRALPCWRALYPAGVPDDFLDAAPDGPSAIKGRSACKAALAMVPDGEGGQRQVPQRDACRYKHEHPTCLWEMAVAGRERAATNLGLGLGKEAEDEHKLVLAAHEVDDAIPLRDTDPYQLARAWLAGGKRRFTLANAARLAPLSGEEIAAGAPVAIELSGDERLMVWGGNPGRGKTVAAIWAIARRGGLYVLEYQLGRLDSQRRPFDVDKAVGVGGVLVVDQLQAIDPDEHRRAARHLDEITHRRFAAGRRTLLIGNIDYRTFACRYGEVAGGAIKHPGNIAERCSQAGSFILFGGPSMRA